MNYLAYQELKNNCNDNNVLIGFFENIRFLESIKEYDYKSLDDSKRARVDEIIGDVYYIIESLDSLLEKDYYLSSRFKVIYNLRVFKKDLSYKLRSYLDMIDVYARRIDELDFVLESKNERKIEDVLNAYYLAFLSLITIINDRAKYDYEMLNKGKYKDDDIKDFKYLNDAVKSYELSLVIKNRTFKNKKEK